MSFLTFDSSESVLEAKFWLAWVSDSQPTNSVM